MTFLIATALPMKAVWADADMVGSKDHPKIPRVAGTTIMGFAESGYDEGVFMTGATRKKILSENIEGKRTRLMYMGPKDLSPLGIMRHYQKTFENLGEVEEVYTCKGLDCFSNLGGSFVWRESNRIANYFDPSRYLFGQPYYYTKQIYWYGKVTTSESRYHVAVYSAVMTEKAQVENTQHHPLINVEIVEDVNFKPTHEAVKAEDMTAKISKKGHIALYGIHFDFDSDVLKPESRPALEEIAKALKADTSLKIYIAGHTDNEGTLEYNVDLSQRRAQAVVKKLISQYDIASARLVPVGVGPAAPIATNKTEEGRTLNRRVELVEH